MYLAYGSYSWATGSVHLQTSVQTEFAQTGRPIKQKHTFNCRGELTAASQSAMKTAILAMEAALRVKNQNLILYQDDASESATLLKAQGSLTGVRVVSGPTYPTTHGAENALFRTWEAVFEAEYPFGVLPDGTGAPEANDKFAVTFTESLTISGGCARYIHKPNVLGVWQKQLVYPITPYVAVQTGQAVGLRGYPVVPPPIFAAALVDTKPEVEYSGPRQEGMLLTDFGIRWTYRYESITPLVGLPHYWING